MNEDLKTDLKEQRSPEVIKKFFIITVIMTLAASVGTTVWYLFFTGNQERSSYDLTRHIYVPLIINAVCILAEFVVRGMLLGKKQKIRNHLGSALMSIILWLISFNLYTSNYEFRPLVCLNLLVICFSSVFKDKDIIKLMSFFSVISVAYTSVQTFLSENSDPVDIMLESGTLILFNISTGFIMTIFISKMSDISNHFINEYEENINQLSGEIIDIQETVILSVAEIIEAKSPQTGQHVKRVSEYVRLLCIEAGYEKEETERIRIASMLHDIGKLSISSEIIEKKGRLTPDEYEVMKTHVTEGGKILSRTPGYTMSLARTIALQHHEKWDGSGYLGLKGESISKVSRIVAIADVFDALVSSRSYKKSWDPDKAYEYITSQSGKQFDPEMVKCFKRCYPKMVDILYKFPENISELENKKENNN